MKEESFFKKHKTLVIVGIIVLVILLIIMKIISYYNNFVILEQNVNSKWSEVENQYQRQADLIPNLVSVVSSAVSTETNFVKEVTEARTAWQSSDNVYDKDSAGVRMSNGITALVRAVSENYPVLQANQQYIALTDELSGTQNRIAVARGRYIEAIQIYNTAIKRFPANLFSNMFGFSGLEYYEAEEGSLDTPELGEGVLP